MKQSVRETSIVIIKNEGQGDRPRLSPSHSTEPEHNLHKCNLRSILTAFCDPM